MVCVNTRSSKAFNTLIVAFRLQQGASSWLCISDQGREFVNSLNEKLFLLTGTEHRIASAYHPQTNGLDERLNQTVTKSLVKYINADQNDWDENLESVFFSYHTSVHHSETITLRR